MIAVGDAMPAARRAEMLAQQLPGLRIEEADVQIIPLTSTRRPIQPGGAP
jgi:hypothetical protein